MHVLWVGLSLLWVGFRSRDAKAKSGVFAQETTPTGALLVAASIVAAIRLRGQEITRSPKLVAVGK
jgi:hypothetical protein